MNNQKQILEGSRAIALTVKNIAPAVVSAYPITPQTHIVEDLAKFKADGQANYEYVRAESEFAAASIILGASATGARVYSATSSQGLLLMTEVLYNIAGLRLPIVMTCANRAVSSPINIWCDHSDVMSMRDAGWIQLFAANNQEAVNQHILAYKLAEKLKLPVMVNVDGFILTHSYEPIIIPSAADIKKYLPAYRPAVGTYLNPTKPITMGAFFTPEHYFETRETLHNDLRNGLAEIKKEFKSFQKIFDVKITDGNATGNDGLKANLTDNGLFKYYGPKNPETILVSLGSMAGTIRETIKNHKKIGLLDLKVYRPFPGEEILQTLGRTKNIAVVEKAVSLGQTGPLFSDLKAAIDTSAINSAPGAKGTKNANQDIRRRIKNYIVGLGGRDVTETMIADIVTDVHKIPAKKTVYPQNDFLKFIGE